jgi:hypothetical protein
MGEPVGKLVWKVLIICLNATREHKISANQDTPENNLAEMCCENNSTSSIHSDHSQLDDSEHPNSLCEDDSDAQSQNSDLDSVEDNISCNSGDESQDCGGQVVRVFLLLKNVSD